MWGPIKVWLLVVTSLYTSGPRTEPHYFYSYADCNKVVRAMRYEPTGDTTGIRCVYSTIYVRKK